MNGPHDVGGDQGFGPLPLERDEPIFHEDWERRVLALTLAMGATGQWNLDTTRSVREALPPATYLTSSYYEIWFEALLVLLERRGLVSAGERQAIDRGVVDRDIVPAPQDGAAPVPGSSPGAVRVLRRERVAPALAAGSPTSRPGGASRYRVGDRVEVRLMNPAGHTRAPRYIRGRAGLVTFAHGPHVLPDVNFLGHGETAEPLYTVRFAAADLWGADTTADAVSVDCWESYLVPAAPPSAVRVSGDPADAGNGGNGGHGSNGGDTDVGDPARRLP